MGYLCEFLRFYLEINLYSIWLIMCLVCGVSGFVVGVFDVWEVYAYIGYF